MTGVLHVREKAATAKAKCHTANAIAKAMGEHMAMAYVESSVMPAAMYAMEMVEKTRAQPVLNGAHNALLAEASLCGIISEWWRGQPQVRVSALAWETKMIAWEAEWMKRTVSLGARLASGTESLAGSLAAVKAPSGGNRVLRRAQSNAGEWKIGLQRGSSPYELSLWKKDLRDAAQLHTTNALKNAADTAKEESGYKGVGMPSNAMYMEALKGEQGEAAAWAALLPHKAYDRVMLRRLKMGAIPNLKCNEAKQCKAYNEIEDVELREEVVACDCGEGPQDAWHFWTECCFSELVRKEARLAAEECVMQDGSSTDQAFWAGLSQEQKLVHAVSSRVRMQWDVEQKLRNVVVPIWVQGAQEVSAVYKAVNGEWQESAERMRCAERLGAAGT